MTIECSNKVLCRTSSKGSSWIDITNKNPFITYLQQVRTLPDTTMITIFLTKTTLILPVLQVLRTIDIHLLSSCKNKVPLLYIIVPKDIRIAEVGYITCDDWVIGILLKGHAIVCAVRNTLCLCSPSRCIKSNNSVLPKSSRVLFVNNTTTTEYGTKGIWLYCFTLIFPVHEVGRGAMCPCHILPLRTVWIVLIVQMPYTILIKHTIRVVHPTISWSVMIDRTELLTILSIEYVRQFYILPTSKVLY